MNKAERVQFPFRCSPELREGIQAIAWLHGLSANEVVEAFLRAGRDANPLTHEQLRMYRRKETRGSSLVIPMSPFGTAARAGNDPTSNGGNPDQSRRDFTLNPSVLKIAA